MKCLFFMSLVGTLSCTILPMVEDPKALTSGQLIQYLLDKYDIKTKEDIVVWDTPEDIKLRTANYDAYCTPKANRKAPGHILQLLAVLAGLKPITLSIQSETSSAYIEEPLLRELFSRTDHQFKYLIVRIHQTPVYFFDSCIFYNSEDPISYRYALLEALYTIEEIKHKQQHIADHYEQAFIHGTLFGYPLDAIRAYTNNSKIIEQAGQAWFAKQTEKTNAQIIDEIFAQQAS